MTVLGARPQFIKAAPVSKELRRQNLKEIIVHTGQHFDKNMSEIFFEEMQIAAPDYNLGINSGTHARQTGQMMIKLEEIMKNAKPDLVLVYGDTNSTLAGALTACKIHIPIAHVEAGLRSFNREMPEEHNRVLTDHCADILFCPTQTAVDNLAREGLAEKACLSGDTMYDALLEFSAIAAQKSNIIEDLKLEPKKYFLATIHRPYNTDNHSNLKSILSAFTAMEETVILPIHPRTRQRIKEAGLNELISKSENLKIIDPVGYLDMLNLEQNARIILTDSGGIQKEAYLFNVPCITLRPETEWVETVESGWNILTGADTNAILKAINKKWPSGKPPELFGDGRAAEGITKRLFDY